ncbi:hypothetical protein C0J52_09131 [Blattella germanica]|nr:hypothetical protein C0J52_09131 [Blattella germanica]
MARLRVDRLLCVFGGIFFLLVCVGGGIVMCCFFIPGCALHDRRSRRRTQFQGIMLFFFFFVSFRAAAVTTTTTTTTHLHKNSLRDICSPSEEKAEAEVDSNPKREAREMHLLSSDTGDKIGINIVPQVALVCLLVLAPVLLTFVVVCCLIQPICPLYKLVHKRAISRIASSRM